MLRTPPLRILSVLRDCKFFREGSFSKKAPPRTPPQKLLNKSFFVCHCNCQRNREIRSCMLHMARSLLGSLPEQNTHIRLHTYRSDVCHWYHHSLQLHLPLTSRSPTLPLPTIPLTTNIAVATADKRPFHANASVKHLPEKPLWFLLCAPLVTRNR